MCLVSPERAAHCEAIIKRQAAREVKAKPDPDGMRELRALAWRYGTDIFDIVGRFLKGLLSAEAAQELFRALAAGTHMDAHILGQEVAGVQGVVRGLAVDRGTVMSLTEEQYFRGFLGALTRDNPRFWDAETERWREDQIARRAGSYTPKMESSAGFGWVDNHGPQQRFAWILGQADHCASCPVYADLSPYWRETLPTVPREGQSECLYNCRCTLETVEGVASFAPVELNLVALLGLAASSVP